MNSCGCPGTSSPVPSEPVSSMCAQSCPVVPLDRGLSGKVEGSTSPSARGYRRIGAEYRRSDAIIGARHGLCMGWRQNCLAYWACLTARGRSASYLTAFQRFQTDRRSLKLVGAAKLFVNIYTIVEPRIRRTRSFALKHTSNIHRFFSFRVDYIDYTAKHIIFAQVHDLKTGVCLLGVFILFIGRSYRHDYRAYTPDIATGSSPYQAIKMADRAWCPYEYALLNGVSAP